MIIKKVHAAGRPQVMATQVIHGVPCMAVADTLPEALKDIWVMVADVRLTQLKQARPTREAK